MRDKPQGHGGAADATAGTWGLLLMGTQGHESMLDADCSQLAGIAADGNAGTQCWML